MTAIPVLNNQAVFQSENIDDSQSPVTFATLDVEVQDHMIAIWLCWIWI
jgi:hypothetical protein